MTLQPGPGGIGYTDVYPVKRMLRDASLGLI